MLIVIYLSTDNEGTRRLHVLEISFPFWVEVIFKLSL